MKRLIRILPLFLSIGLLVGCAGNFQSTESTSSATDDSADRSFHDTIDRLNQQMALDAANAAAQQQFNDSMAAAQQTENQHNAEFNQNSLQ
jgi:ABC-type molybdate transport system substrate-binding protein